MAITSVGYDGTVNEVEWSKMITRVGTAEYGVDGNSSFVVTPATGDRAISVSPGIAWGQGVLDTSNSAQNLLLEASTSGSRWDTVVIRRDWTPVRGVTSLVVLKGTATKAISNSRLWNPGVKDDQPIALVRVVAGSTAIQEIVDLRVFGRNGDMFAKNDLARSYIGAVGSSMNVDGQMWHRVLNASGSNVWVKGENLYDDTGWKTVPKPAWKSGWGNPTDYIRYRSQGNLTEVLMSVTRTGGPIKAGSTGNLTNVAVVGGLKGTVAPASWWHPMTAGPAGSIGAWYIADDGNIYLSATVPGLTIGKGDGFNVGGIFFRN